MSEENRLKNEWDFGAQAWLGFVRTGKDIHRDALNNPAMFKLAGKIEGQLVLDLACGEGYNTRILARKGAKCVGIDFSRKMIDLARKEEEKESLGISYYVVDATDLKQFSDSSFDLVTCFMSLQDIKNYRAGIAEVSRVLKNHGRFIFSIPHPCFENIVLKGKEINASAVYFREVEYPLKWEMEKLARPFKTTSHHRPLTNYLRALSVNNLLVSRLLEPRPTKQASLKHPHLRRHRFTPQSIIVESTKWLTLRLGMVRRVSANELEGHVF